MRFNRTVTMAAAALRPAALVVTIMVLLALPGGPVSRAAAVQDGTAPASPVSANQQPLADATAFLVAQQQPDGSFPGFSGEPDTGTTIDALMALAAASSTGIDVKAPTALALDFLGQADNALVYAQTGVGQAAKLSLALTTVGIAPPTIADVDPNSIIAFGQNEETGIYGGGVYDHALAMLALSASGEDVPESAYTALADTQGESGGWAFDASVEAGAADGNTTALVIQAIVAAGQRESDLIAPAMAFLESTISSDGAAFNDDPSSVPDSNSTAIAIQAAIATDGDPTDLLTALLAFQNDSGAFFYQPSDTSDNLLSTVQAIPALAGVAFPFTADAGDAFNVSLAQAPVPTAPLAIAA